MAAYPLDPLTGVTIEACVPLVGRWKGMYADQPVEEIWFEPIAGQMMGCFRWVREGKVWMYEFTLLSEDADGIVLKIKHFKPDFVGWEEKDQAKVFDLVETRETQAIFRQRHETETVWTIYDWTEAGRLKVWFERADKPHHVDSIFEYKRS